MLLQSDLAGAQVHGGEQDSKPARNEEAMDIYTFILTLCILSFD